jgi:methionyl-tRNA formyltransferase
MISISKTILFFGNERLLTGLPSTDAPILSELIKQGYTIAAVISHYTESQSRDERPLEVAAIAEKHGIPVLLPNRPADIYDELDAFKADAAVLVAYGRIIPQKIIDLFPLGIINIHPSLLPKYRGPTPIESAVLNGDTETGVSIMSLSADMDAGPVYSQAQIPLDGTETKFEVYEKVSKIASDLLFDVLPSILSGELKATPQVGEPVYCRLLTKEDAYPNPSDFTAIEIERQIRAYLTFPKTKMTVAGHQVVVTKARIVSSVESALDIICRHDTYLHIDELIGPSGRKMDSKSFLNGYAAG